MYHSPAVLHRLNPFYNMTDDLAEPGRLSTSSAISLGLVLVLIAGAISYGRQAQRLDSIEADVSEMRVELKQVREILIGGFKTHTPTPR